MTLIFSVNYPCYLQAQSDKELVDGIYLSFSDLMNNEPSMTNRGLASYRTDNFRICVQKLKDNDGLDVKKVNPSKVWGFCKDGQVYIQYLHKDYSKYSAQEVCFFKLHRIETLSLFFTLKVSGTSNSWAQPNNYNPQQRLGSAVKTKIQEYVFCFTNGAVYSLSHDYKQILEIIKTDDQFKNTKIKKKDLMIYIAQYNKRNPVFFEN